MSQFDLDNVPEGWAIAALGNGLAADVQPGFACGANNRDEVGIPHLRPMNVSTEGAIAYDDVKYVPPDHVDGDRRWLKPGDVLFNNTNSAELVGKTALYEDKTPVAFSNHMTRVRCSGAILPKYCALALHQQWREGYFLQHCNRHVSQASIGQTVLKATELPLPPLAEQERIVEKVEALLARVQSVRQRLAAVPDILKHFRQAVLAHACSGTLTEDWRGTDVDDHDDGLPRGWSRPSLSELCTAFQYGSSQKSDDAGDVPVLRMGNLQDGRIDWSNLKFSSDSAEIDKYALEPNTVLFNRTNSPELVGKTAIYRGERPAIFAGYLIRIVHGPEIDPEYLNFCLNEQSFREYCMRVKSDGVSQSNINAKKLAAYEMPHPPLAEQQEIVRRVNDLFALADSIEQRVAEATKRAEAMTQSILARAFRGELVPTEADLAAAEGRDYETAEQLLARIRDASTESTKGRSRRRRREVTA